jgi:2OG-Fe(II) oxygenase superfamily
VNLQTDGYFLKPIGLPESVKAHVAQRDWKALDQAIHVETRPGGVIFEELRPYSQFTEIEFIISIRSSLQLPDDDGIWHDDGSRVLAFSLSLTLDHLGVQGGRLEVQKRGQLAPVSKVIPTPPFGTMIVFATGQMGFEHKINKVTQGERIIIAGWCT